MSGPRAVAAATAALLAVGGCGGGGDDDSSSSSTTTVAREGTWAESGVLGEGRGGHVAVALQNGTVLVVGGGSAAADDQGLKTAELFDPGTGRWRPTLSMAEARGGHAGAVLGDGTVLVVGGMGQATAERYDPATGAWTPVAAMGTPRNGHTATVLGDGRVLVVGGFPGVDATPVASAEVFDPATGRWSPAGQLAGARGFHAATLLPDGRVLVSAGNAANLSRDVTATTTSTTGGFTSQPAAEGGGEVATAEVYDPAANSWSPAGNLSSARSAHTSTLLGDGRVLVTGGFSPTGILDSAEAYDPAANAWSAVERMPGARTIHTATRLRDGRVLVVGGRSGSEGSVLSSILPSAGVFDPVAGTWLPATPMTTRRVAHSATLLTDGRVVVAGGLNESGTVTSSEVFTASG